jgi:hypothetical protein
MIYLYFDFVAPIARAGGKGPAYKDPEAYYDEIQSLKRVCSTQSSNRENLLLS